MGKELRKIKRETGKKPVDKVQAFFKERFR